MRTIKGPGIFLAQFMGDAPPFDSLESAARQMAEFGYLGLQIPTWDTRCADLARLATDAGFAKEYAAQFSDWGVEITELSTHLQGQLIASHPTYDRLYDGFAPTRVHHNPAARTQWATDQLIAAAKASRNLGLDRHVTFSGSLLWPFVYPWPQRPAGLIEEGFAELARRWRPILDEFDRCGVDLCFELHPGEDLHDGLTYERFLEAVGHHPRACLMYDPSHFVLQQLDYLAFIDHYHERIRMFHVKDAEFTPSGKAGVYGGYASWVDRPGRFRSLGDGQIDFSAVFSKLTQYGFDGWAVVEWECAIKHPMDGAREGASFVKDHIIRVTERSFDDFAGTVRDQATNRLLLGL